jgi:hypothetical protein
MIHIDFADWYKAAGLQPVAEDLPKRWEGIEKYEPSSADLIHLAELFYNLGAPTEAFLQAFRKPLHEADLTFSMSNNGVELRVLAGAALVDRMTRGSNETAMLAALSLVTASFQNLRTSHAVPAIPALAAKYLANQTVDRGKRQLDEKSSTPSQQALVAVAALGSPHSEFVGEFFRMQTEVAIVGEESNMLWWLFGERSRDTNQLWKELGVPATSLIAGKELADLTRLLPGPVAAEAFLDKIIRAANVTTPVSIGIRDAINSLDNEWRKTFILAAEETSLDLVLPLTCGVRLSLNSADKNGWKSAFANMAGVPEKSKLPPRHLSHQMYQERLLHQAWNLAKI